MNEVSRAAVLVAFPVVAAAIGAAITAVRRPSARVVAGVQHFAAGVVIAALVGEVLPDLQHQGNLPWAVAGFSIGVVLMLVLGAWGRRIEAGMEPAGAEPAGAASERGGAAASEGAAASGGSAASGGQRSGSVTKAAAAALPLGLLVTVAIDLLIDGLLVGLSVTMSAATGIILTIALTLEVVFLALSVSGELIDRNVPGPKAAGISAALGLLTAVGAIGGAYVLGGASSQVLALGLAFGAAALMYLAVEELIVEAHEQTETWLLSALFFIGFLAIYILAELGG
ncbi:ZIP family metal transporter [Calidifontibacter sp. DB0510]|uniref:ZIP family metal transporter n=1 Tax=Metallococcus carri TaxID=1656884 RepID=A0A967B1W8_9MICO|nr:ZIP family metal transporter [Metallococcus carri]NHN57306.1 ZIP family metal transporter [Metallococcus carri]NOP38089.1 ZIP family metal transporter [Calidifontibacter sp. DB2511S]